jgi:Tol biopolymer transport system component
MKKILIVLFIVCTLSSRAWAGEGIAYSHLSEDGYWQVWTVSPDGGRPRQLTDSKEDKREASWLSDGRLTYRDNNGRVFIIGRDGKGEQEILAKYVRINNPQFSHDGKTVLFTRFDPRSKDIRDIWRSDISGGNAVILTRDNKLALQPSFSPDEKRIVFVKADALRGNHHLWIMDIDGNNAVKLTQGKGQDLFPRFSPDGELVVFTSNRNDNDFDIYTVNVRNKTVQRLTTNAGLDSNPCFSPDGKKIVFVSIRGGDQQLWVMGKDGSNPVQITKMPGESLDPHWAEMN